MRYLMALSVAAATLLSPAPAYADQLLKLLASDGAENDRFGTSVGISGTTAIVGASHDDDNGVDSGSAYLFDTATGQQLFKLLPSDGAAGDWFGLSFVAISGTTAIVGAYQDDDNGTNSGSAYLFDSATGLQLFKLLPSDGAAYDYFGHSVAISGTTAIVGARGDDDNGSFSGSAYLFNTATDQQLFKLLPSDGAEGDQFGNSVAISGTTAIVGASTDDDNGNASGSAYVFDTATGLQLFKLLPSDGAAIDNFGVSVAISGTTAIVGAWYDDDNGVDSGSAYLFDTASGQQLFKLLPSDGAASDWFGRTVAISGTTAIIGASGNDDYGSNSGSAYLFDTASGQQIAKLLPCDAAVTSNFGSGVAITSTTAIVGASFGTYNGVYTGSAYLLTADPAPGGVLPANALVVDDSAAPGGDGTTWGAAHNDIQSALDAAASCALIDQVWVAEGTYGAIQLVNGVTIYGGFTGTETELAQRDPNNLGSIVTQNPFLDNAAITGDGTDPTAVLDGLTIQRPDSPPSSTRDFDFINGGVATIRNCTIITDVEGYLDLDPSPGNPTNLTLINNKLTVIVEPDTTCGKQGVLLELRAADQECGTAVNPDCESGLFDASGSSVFAEDASVNWVIEELRIKSGATLNLSNRDGFEFVTSPGGQPEALYVRNLIIESNGKLNTGLQTVYYDTISGASRQTDVPLYGFSLVNIDMECQKEFDTRVTKRELDNPADDPNDPASPMGLIQRLDLSGEGVMIMDTQADGHPSAGSVVAHGSFARAGEESILVIFEYLFESDGELAVYLSDAPDVGGNRVEVARMYPPPSGLPGAIGSSELATFFGSFPRGALNFTRGTYVELELFGDNAVVQIDNFDPQIECSLTCSDLDGTNTVDEIDYLIALASLGRSLDAESLQGCLDNSLSGDRYVDLQDALAWDTNVGGAGLNPCGNGLGTETRGDPNAVILPPGTELLIAGKPNVVAQAQQDILVAADRLGACIGNALNPASTPDAIFGYRGNGRLTKDGDGALYQIHATQGLVRLDSAQVVIAPSAPQYLGQTIYVGVTALGGAENDFVGLPLSDVAFDPADASSAYVVPVVVEPIDFDPNAPYRYKAAAKLDLTCGGGCAIDDGMFTIVELYGIDPRTDPEITSQPPETAPINVQQLREIEVDDQGNVYVLSASAINDNDWLLCYHGGMEKRVPLDAAINGPTALLVSQATADTLYLAEGGAALADARTRIWRYPITRTGSQATGLGVGQATRIDPPASLDPNSVDIGMVTSLAEDASDGTVYALGFVMPYFSDTFQFSAGDSIFTTGTLATIADDDPNAVPSQQLGCGNLALPISLAVLGGSPSPCTGDVDGDNDVDLTDVAVLLSDFDCTSSCVGDVDGDDDTDLTDLAVLLANFDQVCP